MKTKKKRKNPSVQAELNLNGFNFYLIEPTKPRLQKNPTRLHLTQTFPLIKWKSDIKKTETYCLFCSPGRTPGEEVEGHSRTFTHGDCSPSLTSPRKKRIMAKHLQVEILFSFSSNSTINDAIITSKFMYCLETGSPAYVPSVHLQKYFFSLEKQISFFYTNEAPPRREQDQGKPPSCWQAPEGTNEP